MRHSEKGLFQALEKVLRKHADRTWDCNQLFDLPEVREHAATANRVSDYLGGLWRKGLVTRLPADQERGSRARWSYQWKARADAIGVVGEEYAPRMLVDRPSVLITEEGTTIHVTMPHLHITIRQT